MKTYRKSKIGNRKLVSCKIICIHSAGKVTGTYWCKLSLNFQNKRSFEDKVPVT